MVAPGRPRHTGRLRRLPVAWSVTLTALVIAVVPVLALGLTTGIAQQRALTERAATDLDTLADAQAGRLELIGRAATSNARLVASRTQLRIDTAALIAGDQSVRGRIDAILGDARDATDDLLLVAIADPAGRIVAWAGTQPDPNVAGQAIPAGLTREATADPGGIVSRVVSGPDGPRWLLAAALVLDGEVIGAAVTETDLATVRAITGRPTPDPACTKTNVVYRDPTGAPAFLVPPAPPCAGLAAGSGAAGTQPGTTTGAPGAVTIVPGLNAARALDVDAQLLRDTTDHRGRQVVTATRALPELDWAVVVTAQQAELLAPIRAAGQLIGLGALGAILLAVVLAGLLSRRLSRPLVELQEVTRAVRGGARDARADPDATGELGDLARAVNEMTTAIDAHEQQLETRYADLEVLTHAMAHDLKGPLTGIRGALELLDAGRVASPEQARQLTEMALAASHRMQRLIADLLALIRAQGGPAVREPVALSRLVDQAVTDLDLEGLVRHNGLPRVAGDEVLLDQLVQNLLGNAAAYVAPGVTPRIEISAVTQEDGAVEVRFDDNGVGIPDIERAAVLEPFVRGEQGRALQPGSGLGLSIVARVAERHDGSVRIAASPLGGSRITVTLPAAPAAG